MRMDKTKWKKVSFDDAVEFMHPNGAVQKKDYAAAGLYPIVSQEKDMVSGYSNDKTCLNVISSPVVIFGDHTRVVKYVDFDFVVGADGVKVLLPNSVFEAKFLFYNLSWAKVPNNGYSRHFKFLRQQLIPLPSLPEQRAIAAELDVLQSVTDKLQEQLDDYDKLAQSIFHEMFGDVVNNNREWETKQIKSIGKVVTGNTPSRKEKDFYDEQYIEWLKTDNIEDDKINPTTAKEFLSSKGASKGRCAEPKTILITCIAGSLSSIGRCCILDRKATFNQQINALQCFEGYEPVFVYFVMRSMRKLIQQKASTGMKHIINKSSLELIPVCTPPFSLQRQFAERVEAIEAQKTLVRQQIADARQLFASRMQYYFE